MLTHLTGGARRLTMADLTIRFKGQPIVEMTDTGTKTLKTAGKYCEGDITVEYVKPAGGGGGEMFSSSASGWIPEYQVGHAVSILEMNADMFTSRAIGITPHYKGSAAEVTSGTTLTSQVACNVGDLVIAAIVTRSPLTVSGGWSLISTSTAIAGDTYNQILSWAYKYAESESESITVTQETANRIYINMCSLQGATGYVDNGFVYDTATDTTSFTTTKPSGLTLWAASKPTWDRSSPYGAWAISNNSQSTQLDRASTQPRLALFYDQSNDSSVTFTTSSTGVRTFGSLTIQGMTAFVE